MSPQEQRNERLGAKMVKAMQRRHFDAYYCATASEVKAKVNELIPDGSSVTWGGTMTVRDLEIPQMLRERGTIDVWDRDLVETPEEKQEMYLRAFRADYYLSSANAISEDGVIVNIDGNGNRVAAITWGPQHVIFRPQARPLYGITYQCSPLRHPDTLSTGWAVPQLQLAAKHL